jgi:hypothetical protein
MANNRIPVDLPGMDDQLRSDITDRIRAFEEEHQASVMADGPGWVPRVRGADYLVAGLVNAVIVVWLLIALLGGGNG